jgi:hypothetical protein
MNFSSKFKLATLVVIAIFFLILTQLSNEKLFIKNLYVDAKKVINIYIYGANSYFEKEIEKQYVIQNKTISQSVKEIETSNLPIQKTSIDIHNYYDYPNEGGSLVLINNSIVIIDRLGNFYKAEDIKISKLPFPPIPNGIKSYVNTANVSLDSNSMRVVSGAFDPKNKRLFIGYTKFINKDQNAFAIAYLVVDKDFNPTGNWKDIFLSQTISNNERSHGGGG